MRLSLQATDLGNRVELRNASAHDVIVLGYQNEPYLRVGPRGVFENERWNLPGEPWLFGIDRTCRIAGRLDGGMGTDEVRILLDRIA